MGNCQRTDYRTAKDNDITIPFLMLMDVNSVVFECRKYGIWNDRYEQKSLDLQKCLGGKQHRDFRYIKGYCDQVMITLLIGAFKSPASSLYRAFTKSQLSETRLLILITEF
jgi:hypothetical protein